MNTVVLVLMLLVNLVVLMPNRPHPVPIVHDDEYVLLYPAAFVDIPVLDNDGSPLQDNLSVVAATGLRGGKAEIVNDTIVRVYIDWASYYAWPGPNDDEFSARVAYGTYTVSDGSAQASARWTVWYWPEIQS